MTPTPELPRCAQGHLQHDPGARFCPECGGPLRPPASAGAPSCALHPHLRAFQACGRCGNFVCPDCLRSAPDGSPLCVTCEARGGFLDLPWDRREQEGTLRAFARTCWAIMFSPGKTLAHARPGGTIGSSLWFAVLAEAVTYLTTLLLYSAFIFAMMFGLARLGSDGKGLAPFTSFGIGAAIVAVMAVTFLGSALGLTLLSTALDHLMLRLVGAKPSSFEVTLRAHVLSLAPSLVGLIPICGLYVIPFWALVLRVFAYKHMHRISWGQAAAGALAVPGVLVFVAFFVWLVAIIVASTANSL